MICICMCSQAGLRRTSAEPAFSSFNRAPPFCLPHGPPTSAHFQSMQGGLVCNCIPSGHGVDLGDLPDSMPLACPVCTGGGPTCKDPTHEDGLIGSGRFTVALAHTDSMTERIRSVMILFSYSVYKVASTLANHTHCSPLPQGLLISLFYTTATVLQTVGRRLVVCQTLA